MATGVARLYLRPGGQPLLLVERTGVCRERLLIRGNGAAPFLAPSCIGSSIYKGFFLPNFAFQPKKPKED